MRIELIGRRGCGLCEEAASTLRALGLGFREVDVDGDPDLLRQYTDRVPVLLIDGKIAAEGRIHPSEVARATSG